MDSGTLSLMGFYTTRFVKAESVESVEDIATDLIRNDRKLNQAMTKLPDVMPMIFVEEIDEYKRKPKFKGSWKLKNYGGFGYIFYPMDENEDEE